jgi:DNA-binding MarR family transcriptional regulator
MLDRMPKTPVPVESTNGQPKPMRSSRPRSATPDIAVIEPDTGLDTRYLETLLGYNARRAALSVIGVFLHRMAPFDLRPVDFSVLTLIAHNPGATSRQICTTLDILPPNLVGLVRQLESRGLLLRKPHPTDRRAQGLHLSAAGKRLQRAAEAEATRLEGEVAGVLTPDELATLNSLLRRVYQRAPGGDASSGPLE